MEIVIVVILLSVAAIAVQRIHYRKLLRKKDYGMVRQIREQNRLTKELEYMQLEKNVVEKMLKAKFEKAVLIGEEITTINK